jgi:hypothetical protein
MLAYGFVSSRSFMDNLYLLSFKDITWWVMTDPVIISNEQLNQIKRILFTHVDEDCNPTSVHNEDQSVARRIYPLGDNREIQDCARGSYKSDFEKHGTDARKC